MKKLKIGKNLLIFSSINIYSWYIIPTIIFNVGNSIDICFLCFWIQIYFNFNKANK